MKIFKRQVLILTATVFKMPVSRRGKRRTLEKANGNETGEELNKQKKKIEKERERHFHDTSQSSFMFILMEILRAKQGLCLLMGKLRLPG